MPKLFLFLFILTNFFLSRSLAASEMPDACLPYTKDEKPGEITRSKDSIPYGEGLLWEIQDKNGTKSYIFGTMHSQDRLITSLPPPARLALVKSRKLVMEVIPDQQANDIFNASMYFPDDRNLENMLDTDIYTRLQTQLNDYGIPPENIPHLKPWAAFTLIGRPKPVRAMTQEMVLMQTAEETNKPVVGLETMDEIIDALEGMSLEDQTIILNDTVCNHQKIIKQTRELRDMYMNRQLASMVIFNEQPHYDEAVFNRFMQKILYGRNDKIISRIENYINEGNIFIAIGAMHLPDEHGLLKLLETRGYKLSRIY